MTDSAAVTRPDVEASTSKPTALALWFIIGGAIGLLAAFMLTVETIQYWKDPSIGAACDISPLINCSHNMSSEWGALFGFPNPLIGMMAWPVIITTGVLLLAGVNIPSWYWRGLAFGSMLAMLLVSGFVSISVYSLQALCPWCMLTWVIVIPTFWSVVLYTLKEGLLLGPIASAWPARLYGWVPTLSVACYAVIVLLAQVQINAVVRFLQSIGL